MKETQCFFTLKDVKYHLVDELDAIWKGKMTHYQRGEIEATLEDLTHMFISHLTIANGAMGEFDLPVTVTNDKFIIWKVVGGPWDTVTTIEQALDLSTQWQERLLERNGQVYADYLEERRTAAKKPEKERIL